ncbi:hypothetical protein RYZ59_01035 [Citrobacter sp. HN-141]|uniref:hypothetical protein n=1 Tax=unclassified Citrobacter TaxID=2644389 RepID=UPI002964A497|nr:MULTISPECIES: hypothetical protein [unclassified Citrobacter]MDW2642181.1 hypothetical protein [Citrobacter sp. HN-141]MDW2654328.1 hypothetical protein [Citrobacter sp. HN-120]MDW2697353.1 hypothetical protein [Citrobacter sp. HN-144]
MEPKTLNSAKVAVPEIQQRKPVIIYGKEREKLLSSQGCAPERVVVENNALGDKDKKLPILDIRPGRLKPGVVDADGDIQGNGMSKVSIPKSPPKLQPFTNPPQGPVIPQGWVSQVEHQ